MYVMQTKDGKIHNINSDSDFLWLIREYLGDDAGQWYQERIKPFDDFYNDWKDYIPEEARMRTLPIYKQYSVIDEAIKAMGEDKQFAIVSDAFELPGWDQY